MTRIFLIALLDNWIASMTKVTSKIVDCELRDGNGRSTRNGNGSGRRHASKVKGDDDSLTVRPLLDCASRRWIYRCMIDRSCVSPRGRCGAPTRARAGDEKRAPLLLQRERGKRPLGARSHKVNHCGVHAAETRLPRERVAGWKFICTSRFSLPLEQTHVCAMRPEMMHLRCGLRFRVGLRDFQIVVNCQKFLIYCVN